MQAVQDLPLTQRLEEDIGALGAEAIDALPDAALGDELADLRRCIDRLEAEFLRRLHRFHERKASLADGVSTVSWLRHRCRMPSRKAAHRVHLARALGELPATLESACAGRSPFCNTALIARLANDVGSRLVAPVEPVLVRAAEEFSPGAMHRLVEEARLRLDPDGTLDAGNRAHERRWFACDETYGGIFVLRGELDAEGGMLVKTAIEALMPVTADDLRSAGQRRADALVEIASQQLARGEHGSVRGERPHLTLTASRETLQGGGDLPPAELAGFGPVHPEIARRIACDAVRRDVTVAGDAVPLSVGRSRRTIPPHLREALRLRDNGCRFPGCDRPPQWTDAHHIRHWADGGPTEINNLISLCRRHHRVVHEERWSIRVDDGAIVVTPPPERR